MFELRTLHVHFLALAKCGNYPVLTPGNNISGKFKNIRKGYLKMRFTTTLTTTRLNLHICLEYTRDFIVLLYTRCVSWVSCFDSVMPAWCGLFAGMCHVVGKLSHSWSAGYFLIFALTNSIILN